MSGCPGTVAFACTNVSRKCTRCRRQWAFCYKIRRTRNSEISKQMFERNNPYWEYLLEEINWINGYSISNFHFSAKVQWNQINTMMVPTEEALVNEQASGNSYQNTISVSLDQTEISMLSFPAQIEPSAVPPSSQYSSSLFRNDINLSLNDVTENSYDNSIISIECEGQFNGDYMADDEGGIDFSEIGGQENRHENHMEMMVHDTVHDTGKF